MARKLVKFLEIPETARNVSSLGTLVLDKRSTLGSKALLDLRESSVHKLLARDLLASLNEHTTPAQIESDLTFSQYSKSIQTFLRFCTASNYSSDFRMQDIGIDSLLDYRNYIRIKFADCTTSHRRRLYGDIERLVRAGQELGLASPDLAPPRNFAHARDNDATLPYSMAEAIDIEDACRNHIRETLERLEQGKELLRHGNDPRQPSPRGAATPSKVERPWHQLPNLLWFVVNVLEGRHVKYSAEEGHRLHAFNNAVNGPHKGPYGKNEIYSYLYPSAIDMIPFIILLAKNTGRNETSILTLRRDCLQELDGRYLLWYRKKRGAKVLYKKAIPNDGPYSPVALIKTLIMITEPMVKLAKPEHQEYLLLGFTLKTKGTEPVKPIDASHIKDQMNRKGGWCQHNELTTQSGASIKMSLRRWRVYYLTKRYRQHGQLSKVSRDAAHTLSRTSLSYIDNDSTKFIHEQATEDGIRAAFHVAKPQVVTVDSPAAVSEKTGMNETEAAKLLRGDQDVFFASCKDFYNRPGGEKNTPCDKPWNCLGCSNAIITRHVLPRVIAFRNFLSHQRLELGDFDWNQKFGGVWKVLQEDIFPKFSSQALTEAERSANNEVLYIPISMKV